MKKRKPNRSGWIMLAIVGAMYGFLFLQDADKSLLALQATWKNIVMIAPILLVVLLLMSAMNLLIDAKKISKQLAAVSGVKGWLIAIVSGVISHGSSLVWYPMLQTMREHGVSDGLIVAFLYARAIKVPWLPMMVHYFGMTFTVVLTLYILLGAYLQGRLAQTLRQKT